MPPIPGYGALCKHPSGPKDLDRSSDITSVMILTADKISQRLTQRSDFSRGDLQLMGNVQGSPEPAAVLVPLLEMGKTWHLLFIRRSESDKDRHSGQVAFPGGRRDADDSNAEAAALREAHEEIGLKPDDVRVLGRLNAYLTVTNYKVTPIVGVIPWPYRLCLEPLEVSRCFTIPLQWLANPAHFEIRERQLRPPMPPVPVIYFRPYDGEVLWGATARITLGLIQSLGEEISC